jgi:hypothetical protein
VRLQALPAPVGQFERKPVAFAWALDPAAELATVPAHVAESREYWLLADAGELARGIELRTTAPGAVIRLSPTDARTTILPKAVRLAKAGRPLADALAFSQRHDAAAMRAAGLDVPDGSAVLRIAPMHGAGAFRLQAQAEGRVLVHVYEPDSAYVARAQAASAGVLAGERLAFAAQLQRGDTVLQATDLRGELVSPSGRRYPVRLRGTRGEVDVPVETDTPAGLWELQLYASVLDRGIAVQREVRTAVQVARPTARLGGDAAFDASALTLRLPVQVAAAGRYELRATLYATGRDGLARPVVQAHAANWLDRDGALVLAFGRANLPAGYGAPFEVRGLELHDQTRLGRLETRALALRAGGSRAAPRHDALAER